MGPGNPGQFREPLVIGRVVALAIAGPFGACKNRGEHGKRDRLGQIAREALGLPGGNVLWPRACADGIDRNVDVSPPYLAQQIETAHAWHVDIGQHGVHPMIRERRHGFGTVAGGNYPGTEREKLIPQQIAVQQIVLGNQQQTASQRRQQLTRTPVIVRRDRVEASDDRARSRMDTDKTVGGHLAPAIGSHRGHHRAQLLQPDDRSRPWPPGQHPIRIEAVGDQQTVIALRVDRAVQIHPGRWLAGAPVDLVEHPLQAFGFARQHQRAVQRQARPCHWRCVGDPWRHANRHTRAYAQNAVERNTPTHPFRKPRADGQSEPGSTGLGEPIVSHLRERLEQAVLVLVRNADAGIRDDNFQCPICPARAQNYLAGLRELERIAKQVVDDLGQTHGIKVEPRGDVPAVHRDEAQAASSGQRRMGDGDTREQIGHGYRLRLDA